MIYNQKDKIQKNAFSIDGVLDNNHSGWLEGKTIDEIVIPLCYKTRVKLLSNHKKGQIVDIQEGFYKGTTVTIPYKYQDRHSTVSYLTQALASNKTSLKLYKNKRVLDIENIGVFTVEIEPSMLEGKYYIQIPIRPIKKPFNSDYYNENLGGSRFVQTWFPLIPEKGYPEDIHLHYGSYSKGCITVVNNKEFSVWNKIYLTLMLCRLNDKYITTLSVV